MKKAVSIIGTLIALCSADVTIPFEQIKLTQTKVKTSIGTVPTLYWIPEKVNTKSVIIGLHYSGGSKDIWLDEEHNPLLKYAIETNTPFIACDAYGHGEWLVDGVEGWNLKKDQWPEFMRQTRLGISEVITTVAQTQGLSLDSLHFTGVSQGCLNGMDIIAHTDLKPVTFVLSSPVPRKTRNDERSFHNNLASFIGRDILILSGTNDEYCESGEVQWFFEQINSDRKEIVFYDSPHQLPANQWMNRAVSFLKEKRNSGK